jgi:hypothetical protein
MLDPNAISIYPVPGKGVIAAGKSFATDAEARAWIARALVRRSALLGREIDDVSTFLAGPRKRSGPPLTVREKIELENFAVPLIQVENDGDRFPGYEDEQQSRKAMRKKAHQEALAAYAKRTGTDVPAIPQSVLDAREYSFHLWESVTFSDSATEADVIRAEQLKRTAFTDGADMDAWKSMAFDFAARSAERHSQQVAAVNLERQQAEAKLAAIRPPMSAPGAVPPGAKVHKMTNVKGEVSYDVHDASHNVLASYPATDVPADVVEAAS